MAITFSTRVVPGKTSLERLMKSLAGPSYVRVGLPDTPHWQADLTIAQLGMIHEFGAPSVNIPERPFLYPAIREGANEIQRLSGSLLKQVQNESITKEVALEKLGLKGVGLVQQYIRHGDFEPLKEATIRRKGSSKPLIDSGQMMQSVTYSIEW